MEPARLVPSKQQSSKQASWTLRALGGPQGNRGLEIGGKKVATLQKVPWSESVDTLHLGTVWVAFWPCSDLCGPETVSVGPEMGSVGP